MHMRKVDVIIPTYNRPSFLTKAIGSVLNQTFKDFTIIVVDDGSSEDGTTRVVEGFRDERIKCVRNETNMGEGRSRNIGLMNSNAEYIAFLDDDEWLPEKLELEVNLLESLPSKVGGVYTGFTGIENSSGKVLYERIPKKRGDVYHEMIHENVVGTSSTVLLRRECFKRAGQFDESIPYGLDYDMWIRISKDFHFDCIEKSLIKYHCHEGQLTNDMTRFISGQEALIKKYEHFFSLNKKSYSERYWGLGFLYRESGDADRAWRALVKAIKIYPFEKKNYFSLCKACSLLVLGKRNFHRLRGIKQGVMNTSRYGKFNE